MICVVLADGPGERPSGWSLRRDSPVSGTSKTAMTRDVAVTERNWSVKSLEKEVKQPGGSYELALSYQKHGKLRSPSSIDQAMAGRVEGAGMMFAGREANKPSGRDRHMASRTPTAQRSRAGGRDAGREERESESDRLRE